MARKKVVDEFERDSGWDLLTPEEKQTIVLHRRAKMREETALRKAKDIAVAEARANLKKYGKGSHQYINARGAAIDLLEQWRASGDLFSAYAHTIYKDIYGKW